MSGRVERERPSGELTSQQTQPEQIQQERQPLPDVFDVLERRAQDTERHFADRRTKPWHKSSHKERILSSEERDEKLRQSGNQLARLYREGTDRDRLILDVFKKLGSTPTLPFSWWNTDIHPKETRQLIAKARPMSVEQLHDELRRAEEALERKRKAQATKERSKNFPHKEEAEQLERENKARSRKMLREQAKLQAEHQPKKIFPPSPVE